MTGRSLLGSISLVPLLAGAAGSSTEAGAQERILRELHRTPDGEVLDFHPDGVWRRRGREVSRFRARLLGEGAFATLNAPGRLLLRAPLAAAMTGTLEVPTVLFRYADRGTGASRSAAEVDALLYGLMAPPGRVYTINTFYDQMSNGALDLRGEVVGWVQLDSIENAYTGRPPCTGSPIDNGMCNGLFRQTSDGRSTFSMLNVGLREAIGKVDAQVDFSRFDNDGPDGLPNSGDDDGIVDLVLFIHSEQDGACGGETNNHAWSHKSAGLSGLTSDDLGVSGLPVRFRDYTIQSGVGGSSGCNATAAMPIGTTAHEMGHALGLPDLYDTGGNSQGIGEWGLMGSGNWTTQLSPSRMSPWSLQELGWVTVVGLDAEGWYGVGAAPTADTAFFARGRGGNPNGEYFLIENRQPVHSDSAMLRVHCDRSDVPFPSQCAGGLAVWHIDSAVVAQRRLFNGVNSGPVHGVRVVQADGLNNLRVAPLNRGDGGDLWPGVTGNGRFSFNSFPAAVDNLSNTFVGLQLDSISAGPVGAPAAFFFTAGQPTWVTANAPGASVVVNGETVDLFGDVLPDARSLTIGVPADQLSEDGRSGFTFVDWSDGGAREHEIIVQATGDSLVANLAATHRITVATSGLGALSTTPSIDLAGTFVSQMSSVEIIATAAADHVFDGWTGDTVGAGDTLTLTVTRPFDLVAVFAAVLVAEGQVTLDDAILGATYAAQLGVSGGTGETTWEVAGGEFPPGIGLLADGRVTGEPTDTGSFAATVRARSGIQTVEQGVSLRVGTPVLAIENVVGELLGAPIGVSVDERSFLDFLGNGNGRFDVGDFLAWLAFEGDPMTMAEALERFGGTTVGLEQDGANR